MRIIFHIDMDAFFAAVEEREKPWLKRRPIVVGADPKGGTGRGVVSTANYLARSYGIHSAQPISTAWRNAEQAKKEGRAATIFLGTDFSNYEKTSARIMRIIEKYGQAIERASIDEAYLDVSHLRSYRAAQESAKKIKKEIITQEKITASIGIGPNKLIAKIASAREKPNGLTIVTADAVQLFLDRLLVAEIPGIGPKSRRTLKAHGISTIRELRSVNPELIRTWFGKWGEDIILRARGIDESEVSDIHEIKSIGEQKTFEHDTLDPYKLIKALQHIIKNVFSEMRQQDFITRTVSITIRFSDFETKNRAHTTVFPMQELAIFEKETLRLFLPFLDKRENPEKKLIRLIGVRAENLQYQNTLF